LSADCRLAIRYRRFSGLQNGAGLELGPRGWWHAPLAGEDKLRVCCLDTGRLTGGLATPRKIILSAKIFGYYGPRSA